MLIRDTDGNILNIKRSDFVSDSDYYKQLSLFYGVNLNKLNNINYIKTVNKVEDIVRSKTVKDKILDSIKNM